MCLHWVRKAPFAVDPRKICSTSGFFAAPCSKPRAIEGEAKVVRLPEQDPTTIQEYLNWMNTGEVDLMHPEALIRGKKPAFAGCNNRFALHFLADYLHDVEFANRIMDLLVQLCAESWPATRAQSIPSKQLDQTYAFTVADSPLRKLVLDCMLRVTCGASLAGSMHDLPRDCIYELAGLAIKTAQEGGWMNDFVGMEEKYQEPEDAT